MYTSSMRKSFKDSLKVLEADIQHANTLASDFPREYDGACLQMRMSYSPAAHLFLFLVQWTDFHLAGALGLLRILIYKVYVDGTTTMSTHERKASIREFYSIFLHLSLLLFGACVELRAVIYPSLLQLQSGVTESEDKQQKAACVERYRRREDEEYKQLTDIDFEREEECGICMETNSKMLLPNCNHTMCLKCYREWYSSSSMPSILIFPFTSYILMENMMFPLHFLKEGTVHVSRNPYSFRVIETRSRSQSCPFCRDSLKRVNSGDLWVYTDSRDIIDMATVTRENLRRLFTYIDKLPLIIPDTIFDTYDSHLK
ncbi:hypothetical protein Gotur_034899 [Gossypium turneri]